MLILQSQPCRGPEHPGDQPTTISVEVTPQQYQDLLHHRKLIQEVLPNLSSADRERFITGICPPCWDALFADEGDEE